MKQSLFAAGLLVVCAATVPAVVEASPIIFNNVVRQDFTTPRGAGNSPVANVTVSAATGIDQIGVFTDLDTAGNLMFLIFDFNTSALLFQSGPQAFVDDGLSFKLSNVFPTFTLNPGVSYAIGAIADVGGHWGTNNSSSGNPFTQNGITTSDDANQNVSNFAAPALVGPGTAMIIIELAGGRATSVPEPSSLLLLGTGLVGFAGRAWRKRRG